MVFVIRYLEFDFPSGLVEQIIMSAENFQCAACSFIIYGNLCHLFKAVFCPWSTFLLPSSSREQKHRLSEGPQRSGWETLVRKVTAPVRMVPEPLYLLSSMWPAVPGIMAVSPHQARPRGFSKGMWLEAMNPLKPSQICVASITRMTGRLLWLRFEGESGVLWHHQLPWLRLSLSHQMWTKFWSYWLHASVPSETTPTGSLWLLCNSLCRKYILEWKMHHILYQIAFLWLLLVCTCQHAAKIC